MNTASKKNLKKCYEQQKYFTKNLALAIHKAQQA